MTDAANGYKAFFFFFSVGNKEEIIVLKLMQRT
jgi:hypothetical protein